MLLDIGNPVRKNTLGVEIMAADKKVGPRLVPPTYINYFVYQLSVARGGSGIFSCIQDG